LCRYKRALSDVGLLDVFCLSVCVVSIVGVYSSWRATDTRLSSKSDRFGSW